MTSGAFMQNGENYTIRPAEISDLDGILSIENQCYPNPWSRTLFEKELENPVSTVNLLFFGDRLGGYLCSWFICGELQILNVATSPACRRRGVAAALISHVFERSLKQGMEEAFLEVRVGNLGAQALYSRFGFKTVSCREKYYSDGEDALLMVFEASKG